MKERYKGFKRPVAGCAWLPELREMAVGMGAVTVIFGYFARYPWFIGREMEFNDSSERAKEGNITAVSLLEIGSLDIE